LQSNAGLSPGLAAALAQLAEAGLIAPGIIGAHATLVRFLAAARLLAPDSQVPPGAARAALARACGCGDWDAVVAELRRAREVVAAAWAAAFEENLEIEG